MAEEEAPEALMELEVVENDDDNTEDLKGQVNRMALVRFAEALLQCTTYTQRSFKRALEETIRELELESEDGPLCPVRVIDTLVQNLRSIIPEKDMQEVEQMQAERKKCREELSDLVTRFEAGVESRLAEMKALCVEVKRAINCSLKHELVQGQTDRFEALQRIHTLLGKTRTKYCSLRQDSRTVFNRHLNLHGFANCLPSDVIGTGDEGSSLLRYRAMMQSIEPPPSDKCLHRTHIVHNTWERWCQGNPVTTAQCKEHKARIAEMRGLIQRLMDIKSVETCKFMSKAKQPTPVPQHCGRVQESCEPAASCSPPASPRVRCRSRSPSPPPPKRMCFRLSPVRLMQPIKPRQ